MQPASTSFLGKYIFFRSYFGYVQVLSVQRGDPVAVQDFCCFTVQRGKFLIECFSAFQWLPQRKSGPSLCRLLRQKKSSGNSDAVSFSTVFVLSDKKMPILFRHFISFRTELPQKFQIFLPVPQASGFIVRFMKRRTEQGVRKPYQLKKV